MSNANENNVVNGSKPATDAQMQLIKQLCDELAYSPEAASDMLVPETVEGASQKIHYLKECKLRDAQLRLQNAKVQGFDKITFAMVYKLVWKASAEEPLATKPSKHAFSERVTGEYTLFQQCLKDCKDYVAEGGSQ